MRTWLSEDKPAIAAIIEPNRSILGAWGLPDNLTGVESYVASLAEAAAGLVCFAKIQPAAFERFGPAGWTALRDAVGVLHQAGVPVVLDTKRADHAPVLGDLATTYLGEGSPYQADGLSLLPYLGMAEVCAAAASAAQRGSMFLLVVQTSNAGATAVQHAITPDGRVVVDELVSRVSQHNRAAGEDQIGVVLGGDPRRTAKLVREADVIAVLPGWGRPAVDTAGLCAARAGAPDRVLVSMGSYLARFGPAVAGMRQCLRVVAQQLSEACRRESR